MRQRTCWGWAGGLGVTKKHSTNSRLDHSNCVPQERKLYCSHQQSHLFPYFLILFTLHSPTRLRNYQNSHASASPRPTRPIIASNGKGRRAHRRAVAATHTPRRLGRSTRNTSKILLLGLYHLSHPGECITQGSQRVAIPRRPATT